MRPSSVAPLSITPRAAVLDLAGVGRYCVIMSSDRDLIRCWRLGERAHGRGESAEGCPLHWADDCRDAWRAGFDMEKLVSPRRRGLGRRPVTLRERIGLLINLARQRIGIWRGTVRRIPRRSPEPTPIDVEVIPPDA